HHDLYTLSLHDALPIFRRLRSICSPSPGSGTASIYRDRLIHLAWWFFKPEFKTRNLFRLLSVSIQTASGDSRPADFSGHRVQTRSEEHTSELQSRVDLV